ncbi:MAG: DapH/DapD/GlmU-related protein [Candidatus Bathyarchaeia archaeon]
MLGFISQKAKIEGFVEKGSIVLGETIIGSNTVVGNNVIIGYPIEKSLMTLKFAKEFDANIYDAISKGSHIGTNCIIRSGTVIYESVRLGARVRTGHNVLIREGSVVGDGTLIGSSSILDGTVTIGKAVKIQSNAYLPHLTVIEDDVFIAPNVCFTNDPYPQSERLIGAIVEKNVLICANATILPGVRIGQNAVIGAGSVVTKDVAAETVVVGNPAKFLMTRKEFDKKKNEWNRIK